MVRRSLMYMAVGAWIGRNGRPILWLNSAKSWRVAGVGLAVMAFTFWGVWMGGRESLAARPILTVAGCTGTLCVAILLYRSGRFKAFEFIGRHSMEIYVAHVLGLASVRIFLDKVLGIEIVPLHFLLGILAGLYLPIVVVLVTKRMGFPYMYRLRKPTAQVLKKTIKTA